MCKYTCTANNQWFLYLAADIKAQNTKRLVISNVTELPVTVCHYFEQDFEGEGARKSLNPNAELLIKTSQHLTTAKMLDISYFLIPQKNSQNTAIGTTINMSHP